MAENYVYDAIVIGSGPNGLSAGICLAREGLSVLIVEAAKEIGGGMRSSDELTLPGFTHDICSTIHPLAIGSPVFQSFPLEKFGLEFIQPNASLAHPLDDGTAVLLKKSIDETIKQFQTDGENYKKLIENLSENWEKLAPDALAPLRIPEHPFLLAKFGLKAFRSARGLAESYFSTEQAKALFAGNAAHSMLSLEKMPSAAFGLILAVLGHAVGWGFPRGGSQKIAEALAEYFKSLGGKIETGNPIEHIDDLPKSRTILFDITPRQIIRIAGHRLPASYKKRLENYRYGAGAFKIDFALSEPVPWKAEECLEAGTVHLGGTFDEIARSETEISNGKIPEKPFVLVAQTSLFDETRTPAGKHALWAYCHVPNGSTVDMTDRIENQIERFAPGFRNLILEKSVKTPADLEIFNPNYIGGDINGGKQSLTQLFTRPVAKINPYKTPAKGLYICSSSTPPGGGVHGMCGFHAAKTVLEKEFGKKA